MKINFMRDESVYILKEYIKKNKLTDYYEKDNNNWIKNITNVDDNFGTLNKEFPDFQLKISDNPEKDDLENIKIVYFALKDLTDSQASDERLWAGLCNNQFWNYMQKRWPVSKVADDKKSNFILQHYFFNNGARSTLLNSMARLWWYGRLTYDETNTSNPFELTEYLAKDLNGKGYMLFGSNFSSNRRLLRIFLYTIKDFEDKNNIVLDRDSEFNKLRKKMVLWSGKLLIDYLDENDIKNRLNKELIEIVKCRNKDTN
jgi:hypothetical protein